MLEDVLKEWGGVEVDAMTVYRDLFRLDDGTIQNYGEGSGDMVSNPLGYWKNAADERGHYRVMFADTFEETLRELQEADFSLLNGITYFGRRNTQAAANRMFGMIFDLDGVNDQKLYNLFFGAANVNYYPVPNYVALSGHNVHLYYVFEKPVPLYPNIKLQLKAFKYALTLRLWNGYTSTEEKPQFQGINQGFRVIGGKTKVPGVRVRAFRMNQHPFSLSALNEYIPEESRVDESKLWRESKMTLKQAAAKYPEWYEKRVVQHQEPGRWTTKPDLYFWWLRQIEGGAALHHRYFCVMCLAIYAVKAGIPEDQLRADAFGLLAFLDEMGHGERFTEQDIESALECFDERYCRFPIDDIVKLSGILIAKNKRNGRKRKDHINQVNAIRALRRDVFGENPYENNGRKDVQREVFMWFAGHLDSNLAECARGTGFSKPTVYKHVKQVYSMYDGKPGRPSKYEAVQAWRQLRPDGSKAECMKETGLSRSTVYKYWDVKKEGSGNE